MQVYVSVCARNRKPWAEGAFGQCCASEAWYFIQGASARIESFHPGSFAFYRVGLRPQGDVMALATWSPQARMPAHA